LVADQDRGGRNAGGGWIVPGGARVSDVDLDGDGTDAVVRISNIVPRGQARGRYRDAVRSN
jgi:hypothetical protein